MIWENFVTSDFRLKLRDCFDMLYHKPPQKHFGPTQSQSSWPQAERWAEEPWSSGEDSVHFSPWNTPCWYRGIHSVFHCVNPDRLFWAAVPGIPCVTRSTYCLNWYFQEEKAQKQRRSRNRVHLLGHTIPRMRPSSKNHRGSIMDSHAVPCNTCHAEKSRYRENTASTCQVASAPKLRQVHVKHKRRKTNRSPAGVARQLLVPGI